MTKNSKAEMASGIASYEKKYLMLSEAEGRSQEQSGEIDTMKTRHIAMQSLMPFYLWLPVGLLLVLSCNEAQTQTAPIAQAVLLSKNKAEEVPADLTTDVRLDRPLSLHEIGLPLRSLLLKVGQDDLSLSADHNCDTLELHLNLINRPRRQLMNSLAQLVPGQWYHTGDGKGYVLRMNRKAAGRRARWWDLYLGERQRVLQAIPEMALKAMGARPEIKGKVGSADGNDEGFEQFLLAGPTFFNQLPATLQKQIAHSLNETSLFAGARGTGMNEGAMVLPFTDLPSSVQERLQQGMRQPARVELGDVYGLFKNDGNGLSAELVDAAGTSLGAGFSMDIPLDEDEPTLPLHHNRLLWEVKRREKLRQDVPPPWKELAAYQESRVWPNAAPLKGYIPHNDRISDLEKWAKEDMLEFVSDYYSRPIGFSSGPMPKLSPQAQEERNKLENRLNVLAAEEDLSWKPTADKIYLLRNNRWYRDDRLEVPAPLLQRWLKQELWDTMKTSAPALLEGEPLRRLLDWQAEVVSTLTPWQLFNGLKWVTVPPEKRKEYALGMQTASLSEEKERYRPFLWLVNFGFSAHYRLLQFYANLNKEQRTALLRSSLDFYTLTADQQQQAIYLQPLLIAPAGHTQPIVLGLRHPPGSWVMGDTNVRLIFVAPALH